jgi:hypothetical protein
MEEIAAGLIRNKKNLKKLILRLNIGLEILA